MLFRRWASFTLFLTSVQTNSTTAGTQLSHALAAVVQQSVDVWVNTSSHVYHCPGARYFGATKRGRMMREADARAEGNRPAYGAACSAQSADVPLGRSLASSGAIAREQTAVQVWLNVSTHVYHCPGTRYYGATKRGQFMTEEAAQKAGSRPAYGRGCR